ncbi:MAG: DUF4115 domain-containing protein [Nitrospirae bacterium]|nr:DUF4115 domain-containing protein [Nitrospirota bacterium]
MSKILKQKREELGEELRDISLVVRIRTTYLKAIEEEDFTKLPAEVYAKGYIREYARYLDVPLSDAVLPYQQYLDSAKQDIAAAACEPAVSAADRSAYPVLKPSLFIPKLFIICIAAAIAFGIYVFVRDNWQTMGRGSVAEMPAPVMPSPEIPSEPTPNAASDQPAQQSVDQQLPSAPTSANTASDDQKSAAAKSKYILTINATDQVWLEINADDKSRNDIIMNAGETQSFRADGIFKIKIGNAAGVKFSFNGREIGPLGAKGEVVYLTLPEPHQSAVKPFTTGSPASAPATN